MTEPDPGVGRVRSRLNQGRGAGSSVAAAALLPLFPGSQGSVEVPGSPLK